jgi:hypothetical protein
LPAKSFDCPFREFPKRRRARSDASILYLGVPRVIEKTAKRE